jgi:ectoine hydroxylase-related dioxygenase (phytanoyl-CoA dioxygenase family)
MEEELIVTQQHIETFRRDGVVLLKGVLDSKVVESGRLAVEDAIAHPGPQAEFIRANSTWTSVSNDFGAPITPDRDKDDWIMFQDQFSSTRCPKMARFVREESNVGRIAAELMQSKTATFFYDHVICKRPNLRSKQEKDESTSIPWHQDLPYWNVDGSQIASVWIPFDAMPEDSTDGVTWIIGSHSWGLFRPRHFVDASPYEGTEHLPDMPPVEDWVASGKAHRRTFAGDVLVFDARIIHCSGTNMDQTPHRRVALRFGGDDAVYFERPGETAIPTPDIHHGLSHGDPLACEAFPLVWNAKLP